jgi:hypothetical protein
MQVEDVCCDFEQDGIYVTVINKCAFVIIEFNIDRNIDI